MKSLTPPQRRNKNPIIYTRRTPVSLPKTDRSLSLRFQNWTTISLYLPTDTPTAPQHQGRPPLHTRTTTTTLADLQRKLLHNASSSTTERDHHQPALYPKKTLSLRNSRNQLMTKTKRSCNPIPIFPSLLESLQPNIHRDLPFTQPAHTSL